MPSPYGSLANPVSLDPFQNIVSVHWQGAWLQLILRFRYVSTDHVGGIVDGSGGGSVDPDNLVGSYVNAWHFEYVTGGLPDIWQVISSTGATDVTGALPGISGGVTLGGRVYSLGHWYSAFDPPTVLIPDPGSMSVAVAGAKILHLAQRGMRTTGEVAKYKPPLTSDFYEVYRVDATLDDAFSLDLDFSGSTFTLGAHDFTVTSVTVPDINPDHAATINCTVVP